MTNHRHNLTLVVEADLLRAARQIARERRTSLNRLVCDYLATLVELPARRHLARAHVRAASEAGLVELGERRWSREELHKR
jgi:hypothetical protein